jgi:glycosyltransferase involved in cell wall biosynthesis
VSWILSVLLVASLIAWIWFAVRLARTRALPSLAEADGEPPSVWPRLSVVVACRNEEATVEKALGSLAAQDYPGLEIVAVDDRSTDGTAARLAALAGRAPCLRMVRVTELPAGWLGKTHALQRGQEAASGELLLFTDADVVFAPGALRRAVAWFTRRGLGHGVAFPRLVAPGFFERAFVATFGMFFLAAMRLEDLARAGTRAYVGLGAFNLVDAAAYRRLGGHERLRLEVLDDMKLGMILRRSGVRQGAIDSGGLVEVRWQEGLWASMRGLLKNGFAESEYRWWRMLFNAFGVSLLAVVPAAALVAGVDRPLALAPVVLGAIFLGGTARRVSSGTGLEGVTLPLTGLALAVVGLASAALTTARRGIVWRDTRYPLDELRAACVRDADWPPDRTVAG